MAIRVLVVDDEEDTLNLLSLILQISGYDPLTTLNSVEAIALAETKKPEVVILDIMMPKLDGFTLCKMMRQNPVTRNLPIIFVTAYSALDIEDRRKEAGADLILPKPIGMDSLISTITEAVTLRKPNSVEESLPVTTEKPNGAEVSLPITPGNPNGAEKSTPEAAPAATNGSSSPPPTA